MLKAFSDNGAVPFDDLDSTSEDITKDSFSLSYGSWQNSLSFRAFTFGEWNKFEMYSEGIEGYCNRRELNEDFPRARIDSEGDLWQNDVTAFSINGRRVQTDATNGYIDSMQKYTYVPDEVFDAFLDFVEETLGFTPEWVPHLNSYVWPA